MTASLLNLGGADLILVLVIVMLLFGARKLPDLARGMGEAMREFSKAKDEFEEEIAEPVKAAQPMSWRIFTLLLLATLLLATLLYLLP